MTIEFPPIACNRHPSWRAGIAALALVLVGCGPTFEAATLEARPTGKYAEVLSWSATATESGPTHKVEVEIEIDEAQLMGWARTTMQYNCYLDVRIEQPGKEFVEFMLMFPITEERVVSESKDVIQIAYQAAGEVQPSGFRLVPKKTALTFKPVAGENVLSVHLRTPAGADRQALRAIRTVRMRVLTGKDGPKVLSNWTELPRTIRKY